MNRSQPNGSVRDLALFGLFFAVSPALSLVPFGAYLVSLLLPAFMFLLSFKRSVQLYCMAQVFVLSIRLCYGFNPWLLVDVGGLALWLPSTICGIYIFKRQYERHLALAFVGYLLLPVFLALSIICAIFGLVMIFAKELLLGWLTAIGRPIADMIVIVPVPNLPAIELPVWAYSAFRVLALVVLVGIIVLPLRNYCS